jgi:hypothetical protein
MSPGICGNKKSAHLWLRVKALNLNADLDMDGSRLFAGTKSGRNSGHVRNSGDYGITNGKIFVEKKIIVSWAMFVVVPFL